MKGILLAFILIMVVLLFWSSCNGPLEPDNNQASYWPEIGASSPLSPGACGFCAMILDTVYNEEVYGEYEYVIITTSSGDEEVQELHWDHYWMVLVAAVGDWPVLFNGNIVQKDGKFQFNGRDQDGWLQVRYDTRFENKTFFFRFVWEIE